MFAVIFEVEPKPGRAKDYLDLAAKLRPELEKVDGFLSIERFQSLTTEGKYLSLSFWTATAFSPSDVSAIKRWAKLLMMMEAAVSLAIGLLVIARAVNILR